MKKNIVYTIATIFTLIVLFSFTYSKTGQTNTNSSITGEELYLKNCSSCHGQNLEGNPPAFPSLKEVNKKMSKDEILSLLETGRKVMPSFAHLSIEEREAITGYLLGEKTKSNVVSAISPLEEGKNLFVANCASCHKVKQEDSEPARVQSYGMRPAILGGINRKHNYYRFERILNMGPCYMPSFARMPVNDKEKIYKYLSSVEPAGYWSQNGCRMNNMNGY